MRLPNLTHAERAEWERLCEKAGIGNLARQAAAFQQIKSMLAEDDGIVSYGEIVKSVYKILGRVDDVR